jgi:diaminopimelate epimerase
MRFIKMQGAGNDFIMIEGSRANFDWSKLAKFMCDRRFGVGADGLIVALPSKVADLRMRIYNSDGSEAEMCGNGIRCLAKFAIHRKLVHAGLEEMTVETIPGMRKVKLSYRGAQIYQIQVSMGRPVFSGKDIPLDPEPGKAYLLHMTPIIDYPFLMGGRKLALNLLSMGNPHAVYFTEQPLNEFPLNEIGPGIENHRMFPKRINFEVARVMNWNCIEVRVWERGAGETLACGTGACAVAVASRLHNYTNSKVDIILPGGKLNVEWDGEGEVLMSGPAEIVFNGEWPE